MSDDVSRILKDWPYQPGQLSVRIVDGDDGRPKIQLRLDLGLLQMEFEGRPDGQRPGGYESLLEMYEAMLDDAEEAAAEFAGDEPFAGDVDAPPAEGGVADEAELPIADEPAAEEPDPDDDRPFVLDGEACRQLREEAVQYYHRYVALFILEDYEGVVRDTSRNLRVLDLCARYAQSDEDRTVLEQFRPYILMMRARALASQAVKDKEPKAAILSIDEALERIRDHFSVRAEPELFEESGEVQLLKGMRDALVPKLPVSQKSELRDRLKKALEQENYELAAILRDELKMMPD